MAVATRRSSCNHCGMKMKLVRVTHGPVGFEHRYFECRACYHDENVVVALDPQHPNRLGWLFDEDRLPLAKTNQKPARMVRTTDDAGVAGPLLRQQGSFAKTVVSAFDFYGGSPLMGEATNTIVASPLRRP